MSKIIGGILLVLIGLFGLIKVTNLQSSEISPGLSRIGSGERGAMVGVNAMNDQASSDSLYDAKKFFFVAALISGLVTIFQGYVSLRKKDDEDSKNDTLLEKKVDKKPSSNEELNPNFNVDILNEANFIIKKLEKYKYKLKSFNENKIIWTLTGSSGDFDCNYSQLKDLLRNFERN